MDAKRFAEILGEFFEEVRTDYSGRGTNGKTCIGAIVESEREAQKFTISALVDCEDHEERAELGKILRKGRIDGMGKSYILYFPGVSVDESEAA